MVGHCLKIQCRLSTSSSSNVKTDRSGPVLLSFIEAATGWLYFCHDDDVDVELQHQQQVVAKSAPSAHFEF
jgi:hypothetical protein